MKQFAILPPSVQRASDVPVDCETQMLLRCFLTPVFEQATSWTALAQKLATKGYGITVAESRMFVTDGYTGQRKCTGSMLGVPLASLEARLGPVPRDA